MSTTHTVTTRLHLEAAPAAARTTANQRAKRRRMIRYGLLAFNALVLLAVGYMIIQSAGTSSASASPYTVSSAVSVLGKQDKSAQITDPLDRLSSADIAV